MKRVYLLAGLVAVLVVGSGRECRCQTTGAGAAKTTPITPEPVPAQPAPAPDCAACSTPAPSGGAGPVAACDPTILWWTQNIRSLPPHSRNLAPLYTSRGERWRILQRYEAARQDFEAALAVDPQCVPALQGLGNTEFAVNKTENVLRADRLFTEAIEYAPEKPGLHFGRAQSRQALADETLRLRRAFDDWYQGLQNPDKNMEHYRLYMVFDFASTYRRHIEAALRDFATELRLNPDHPHLEDEYRAAASKFEIADCDYETAKKALENEAAPLCACSATP